MLRSGAIGFALTRDPLERAVSAYYSKMACDTGDAADQYVVPACILLDHSYSHVIAKPAPCLGPALRAIASHEKQLCPLIGMISTRFSAQRGSNSAAHASSAQGC